MTMAGTAARPVVDGIDVEAVLRAEVRAVRASVSKRWRVAELVVAGIVTLGAYYGVYAALVFFVESMAVAVVLAVALGAIAAVSLMTYGHPFTHRLSGRWLAGSGLLGAPILGFDLQWWKSKHNRNHHHRTNQNDDDDLDIRAVRLSPGLEWKPMHRLQPWLLPVGALGTHLGMVRKSTVFRFQERPDLPYAVRVARAAVAPGWLVALMVPPMLRHGVLATLVVAAIASLTIGAILGAVFLVNHVVEGTEFGEPSGGFHEWQVRGSSQYAISSLGVTLFTGGLNLHVAHHLMPRASLLELWRLSHRLPVVCAEIGLPLTTFPSWRAAWRSHRRVVRQLAQDPNQSGADAIQARPAVIPASTALSQLR